MVRYFKNSQTGSGLIETNNEADCLWIHLEAPSKEELAGVALFASIPEPFLNSALDDDEAAHIDSDGDIKLTVIDIPSFNELTDGSVSTVPLILIQSKRHLVSVCGTSSSVLDGFFTNKVKNIDAKRPAKTIYQIIYHTASRFLYYLRQIDKASDKIQRGLSKSMQNKEILQLLELQKSLVFFSASLTANNAVAQKIINNYAKDAPSDEKDILDDILIEYNQALEMCLVYREIINTSMDTFASVVNNNQNRIMKFLTAITIILTIPMILAGFWGMNTDVPFSGALWGFYIIVGISILLTVITWIIFYKKKMM